MIDYYSLCEKVLELFALIDDEVRRFKGTTGLKCKEGCGDCCTSVHPYDTVLSLLPAAVRIIDSGQEDWFLDRISEQSQSQLRCVFYVEDSENHCTIYSHRPLVCRLFGFAGWRDKYGVPQYRLCRHITRPQIPNIIPPLYITFSTMLDSLYPPLGNNLLPLNQAVFKASERLLLDRRYKSLSISSKDS